MHIVVVRLPAFFGRPAVPLVMVEGGKKQRTEYGGMVPITLVKEAPYWKDSRWKEQPSQQDIEMINIERSQTCHLLIIHHHTIPLQSHGVFTTENPKFRIYS